MYGLLTDKYYKMEIQDLMKVLCRENITTSMHFNKDKEQCYIDLETRAKSELHLYEDGVIRGRYNYEEQIDLNQDIDDLIRVLCEEFNHALHGRSYYQEEWGLLCEKIGVTVEAYI